MSNENGNPKKRTDVNKAMEKKTSKTVRVTMRDWLYLYELVGDERPMREAVSEVIEAHKELEEMEDMDLEDL